MYMTAKMDLQKAVQGNVILHDTTNKVGSPRHYTYETPFFNYGPIPQTWEGKIFGATETNLSSCLLLSYQLNWTNHKYQKGFSVLILYK